MRSESGVEIDAHAVRIEKLRVALSPERVPRLLVAVEAGGDDARVRLVDVGGARALEGERHLIPGLARPLRAETEDDVLPIEHEPDAVREERIDVPVLARLRPA